MAIYSISHLAKINAYWRHFPRHKRLCLAKKGHFSTLNRIAKMAPFSHLLVTILATFSTLITKTGDFSHFFSQNGALGLAPG
jgi:hypothetical protein